MTKPERAGYLHAILSEYGQHTGLRIVCHILDDTAPFPAPQMHDHTVMDEHAMCILPDGNRPVEETDAENSRT